MSLARAFSKPYQEFVFWRAMRRLVREVTPASRDFDAELLSDLIYGWGNSWSARHEFLDSCLQHVRKSDGPILECGSGLSTLLVGALAQQMGKSVWTLEHDAEYACRVQGFLDRYGVHSVKICVSPLEDFGEFDWYQPPAFASIPGKFSLVICDGPPGGTRGGRFGLVPVMREKLRPDCTILLDDGGREDEREIASLWAAMLGAHEETFGTEKPFIRLRAGLEPPSRAA
jgi:hypothetical protein